MSRANRAKDGLSEFAPAKINLTLHVGRARADGYHPLDSLVVFADWGDMVSVRPGEGLHLALEGAGADALRAEPHNLVLKAGWALRAAVGKPELGAALTLDKRLPAAAGLGGGSADAAAALRLLNRFWDLGLSARQLAEIGTTVGADVPACVHSRPLRMRGIGERIDISPAWPELDAVILHPGEALSTASVFGAYDETDPAPLDGGGAGVAGGLEDALKVMARGRNDLEAPAKRLAPVIGEALKALGAAKGARLARMSGSGASCFAVFDSAGAAQAAAKALHEARPGWRAWGVRLGGALQAGPADDLFVSAKAGA